MTNEQINENIKIDIQSAKSCMETIKKSYAIVDEIADRHNLLTKAVSGLQDIQSISDSLEGILQSRLLDSYMEK